MEAEYGMITILSNGDEELVPENLTLKQYLERRGINAGRVACELNGKIIRRHQWGEHTLCHDDCLEVITLVGGG